MSKISIKNWRGHIYLAALFQNNLTLWKGWVLLGQKLVRVNRIFNPCKRVQGQSGGNVPAGCSNPYVQVKNSVGSQIVTKNCQYIVKTVIIFVHAKHGDYPCKII